MKNTQQGMGLIILIIGLALIALMAGLYFTQSGEKEKSRFETGQDGVKQAEEINQQSSEYSDQLKQELE